ADVNGVVLTLSSPSSLTGRLSVDGGSLSAAELANIRVWLRSSPSGDFGPQLQARQTAAQPPAGDGSFVITGVTPGDYLLERVVSLPSGFFIREARFNQTDVLSQPMRFTSQSSAVLEIVVSRRAGELSGFAMDPQSRGAREAQVVLVPELRNRTDLYKTALTD